MQPPETLRSNWKHRVITIASRLTPDIPSGRLGHPTARRDAAVRHLLEKEKVTIDELFTEIFDNPETTARTVPVPNSVLFPIVRGR